ncbi:TPA: DUF362 domain-containing protein, partial [Candidatus Poribacteria bacterium]|nr:DUF362 domain-containing protein [Candidatus Poribacteria bacterium]
MEGKAVKTESITRRDFLKRSLTGIGGVMLAESLGSNIGLGRPLADMSRVVVARHPEATDGVKAINPANVQAMMDESIKRLTGKPSVADAWASVLPDFKQEDVIAIKVNVISALIPTHPELVNTITAGLTAAGVPENNIIVYDRSKGELIASGYQYNAGDVGARCFGTHEKDWGYDWDNSVDILGQKRALSSIVTRCDHLINVPVLKVHMAPYGVTLSLKNHYGSVDNPSSLHPNFAEACATLNSQEAIKDKTRLVVIDALFGFWGSNPAMFVADFAYNGLIMSKEPVAADYTGTEILNEERAKHNQPPRNVPLLKKAAEMGLGTNEPENIELLEVELEAAEKEKIE